jgi:hypothetical protein
MIGTLPSNRAQRHFKCASSAMSAGQENVKNPAASDPRRLRFGNFEVDLGTVGIRAKTAVRSSCSESRFR